MHCWFCENPLSSSPAGLYCPFADCPACKDEAGAALLDGAEPERWRRMREAGSLALNLLDAGLAEFLSSRESDLRGGSGGPTSRF